MPNYLMLTVTNFRDAVTTDQSLVNYVLVSIEASPELATVESSSSGEIVLVLDRSGSMDVRTGADGKSHIERVIAGAREIVSKKLRPNDKLGIVGFDDSIVRVCPLTPGERKADILKALDEFEEICRAGGGGTQLAPAIREALDLIKGPDGRPRTGARILVMTDGDVWDPDETLSLVRDLPGQSIGSLGFGEYNFDFMNQVVAPSKGLCMEVEDLSTIHEFFEVELAVAQNTVATNMRLKVKATPFVEMRKSYIQHPNPTFLGRVEMGPEREYEVDLPVLERDHGMRLMFDIEHKPRDPGSFSAFEITLTYDVPALGIVGAEVVGNVVVEYTADASRIHVVDNSVAEAFNKCFVEENRERLAQAVERGDVAEVEKISETIRLAAKDPAVRAIAEETVRLAKGGDVDKVDMKRLTQETRRRE